MRAAQQKVSGLEANIANQDGGAFGQAGPRTRTCPCSSGSGRGGLPSPAAAVDELSTSLQRAGVNTRAMGSESARLGSQLETCDPAPKP